jgi:hypothetical protein
MCRAKQQAQETPRVRFSKSILSAALAAGLPALIALPAWGKQAPAKGAPGTMVSTPPDMTYYALQGDTLGQLAQRYTGNVANWTALAKRNHIGNERTIPVGTAILIPLDLLPEQPATATVAALAGSVSVQAADGAQTELKIGDVLNEGSRISTGKSGFVSLALADNTRISIPSNSQVMLSKLRATRYTNSPRTEVKLLEGRVESKVTPLESRKGRYEVRSPLAIAGVRGTQFRVVYQHDSQHNSVASEVLDGRVAVAQAEEKPVTKSRDHSIYKAVIAKQAGAGVLVPAGQGNIVSAHALGKPVTLLPAPTLDDGYQLQERPTIQLAVNRQTGAQRYRAQIAQDKEAQDLRMEALSAEPHFKFDGLPDGDYFVRVTAIDAQGLEGLPTVLPFRLKARPEPPFSTAPKAKLRADQVAFGWTESNGATGYRLQVADEPSFAHPLLDQQDIHDVHFDGVSLKPGRYYWRLASVAMKQGQPDQGPWGDTQSLVLARPQTMGTVDDDGGKQLMLRWPSEPGQHFLVQVARDAQFTDLALNQQTEQAELAMPRPPAGVYFIRVQATDSDGYVGAFSAAQKLTILSRWVDSSGEPVKSSAGPVRDGY